VKSTHIRHQCAGVVVNKAIELTALRTAAHSQRYAHTMDGTANTDSQHSR
jgi:hypothetical protein